MSEPETTDVVPVEFSVDELVTIAAALNVAADKLTPANVLTIEAKIDDALVRWAP